MGPRSSDVFSGRGFPNNYYWISRHIHKLATTDGTENTKSYTAGLKMPQIQI